MNGSLPNDPLVTATWLMDHYADPNIIICDATWVLPNQPPPLVGAISGARRFDIDTIADPLANTPHMLPNETQFQSAVQALGINHDSDIIIYDRQGLFSAPRAWWMFRVFGHNNVRVLNGGFPAWVNAGGTISEPADHSHFATGDFKARFRPELVKTRSQVLNALHCDAIVDARSKGRFDGTLPEPRKGIRSGHMPSATSLPFSSLKTADGFMKPCLELAELIGAAGLDLNLPIISSCGSGITACGLALAFARLGIMDVAVYDGSWVEWATYPNVVEHGLIHT